MMGNLILVLLMREIKEVIFIKLVIVEMKAILIRILVIVY